jgi:hypothetical protein
MSIFKAANKKYYVQVMKDRVYHRGGQGFDKKEQAKVAEQQIKSQLRSGQPVLSFKLFLDLWVEYMKESEQFNGKAWFNVKKCIATRYFREWFARSVESITANEIINHMIERKKLSARSANLDFEILKAFFMWMEKRGYLNLQNNPFRQGLKKFPVDTKEKEIPSTDTVEKLIASTEGTDHLLILLLVLL